jgi:hypothetical protein
VTPKTTQRVAALRQRRASQGLVRLELYVHPEDRAAIEQTPRVRALLEDLLQAVEAGTVTPVLIRACRDAL